MNSVMAILKSSILFKIFLCFLYCNHQVHRRFDHPVPAIHLNTEVWPCGFTVLCFACGSFPLLPANSSVSIYKHSHNVTAHKLIFCCIVWRINFPHRIGYRVLNSQSLTWFLTVMFQCTCEARCYHHKIPSNFYRFWRSHIRKKYYLQWSNIFHLPGANWNYRSAYTLQLKTHLWWTGTSKR
jgi:hypothetical protein